MSRRSMDPGFDQRIADWLEDDPDDAPDAVLTTVLAAFPSIPQRRASRVPWRFPAMNRFAQLGAVAVVALAVVGGALFILRPGPSVGTQPSTAPSTPASTPSSSPSSSPSSLARATLEKDFTSARYGYIVAYLPGWTVVPATKKWVVGTVNNWNSGYNDELHGSDIRFSGAAQRLAVRQTPDAWLTALAAGADPTSWPVISIAGADGRLDADGAPAAGGTIAPGGVMFDAVVIKDGVAYNFNMDGRVDRASFDAVLSTVRLPASPACGLVTTGEIAVATGNPGLGAHAAGFVTGSTASCTFTNGATDVIAKVVLTSPGGAAAFDAAKARPGVETVAGIGDGAVYDPATATLSAVMGDSLVQVIGDRNAASARQMTLTVAQTAIGRL